MSMLYDQLIRRLPFPTTSYAGKTVIVTGSNVGLGKEAARHFARLSASTIILAVRSLDKGNAAKADIDASTKCAKDVIQVWHLDMTSYASVQAFTARAERELERVDVLLLNAGVAKATYSEAEGTESTITVNVLATFLLMLLMLPKLKQTAAAFDTRPTLTVVSSGVHAHSPFREKAAPEGHIFDAFNDKASYDPHDRYPVSKLLEVFGVRAFAERHPASSLLVTVNYVDPGLCHSELARDAGWDLYFLKLFLARSTEYGSRTLVHAASQGPESYGQYLSSCMISSPSPFVLSEEGKTVQDRVWDELVERLEVIKPGVTKQF